MNLNLRWWVYWLWCKWNGEKPSETEFQYLVKRYEETRQK